MDKETELSKEFRRGLLTDPVKQYYEMDNIGSSKYSVNFSYGTYKDGSTFFGIDLFKNKKKRDAFIKLLLSCGYHYQSFQYKSIF